MPFPPGVGGRGTGDIKLQSYDEPCALGHPNLLIEASACFLNNAHILPVLLSVN
ncbi:hypothetical protein Ancab_032936 [Ancistrocladus abbreviatus]